ncbi:hypothetical protein Vadar_012181 [Vaccinium darrowii]|uniref:Uncharacterized protein n=1 Tax=Vaccinium darrowii TaxID=229202 RepID=A0ACB7XZ79_9ERIC|nr:hypothetical protein Vadar_012181 [Vaccinium darrowii]
MEGRKMCLLGFLVSLVLMRVVGGAEVKGLASCNFPAIYNFGDSNSDTGACSVAVGPTQPPEGQTFFGKPAGRACDGRLIIDFIAEELGIPYLSPYLDSVGSNFSHGANFAYGGSTIWRQPWVNGITFHLAVQTTQFSEFKARTVDIYNQGKDTSRLPRPEDFSKALYTLDIGQNDVFISLYDAPPPVILELVNNVTAAVQGLYDQGGRAFWIHNIGPNGCLPTALKNSNLTKETFDKNGCINRWNEKVKEYNRQLEDRVIKLRAELPEAAITYVDVYTAKYNLISNAKNLGFTEPLKQCVVRTRDGKVATICDNPSTCISWDGVHYTEAANHFVAKSIMNGSLSDPPVSIANACHKNAFICSHNASLASYHSLGHEFIPRGIVDLGYLSSRCSHNASLASYHSLGHEFIPRGIVDVGNLSSSRLNRETQLQKELYNQGMAGFAAENGQKQTSIDIICEGTKHRPLYNPHKVAKLRYPASCSGQNKEAGRTSVLSRKWRYLWTFITRRLNFDYWVATGATIDSFRYASLVNQVLKLHQGRFVDEFIIRFCLHTLEYHHVESWIKFAFEKGVKRFELDLDANEYPASSWTYNFPSMEKFWSSSNTVQGMQSYGHMTRAVGSVGFSSLTILRLSNVNVTDEVIENFLGNCPLLEELHVIRSKRLQKLKVVGVSLKLKSLKISNCIGLRALEICAINFVSLSYNGIPIRLLATNVPVLSKFCVAGDYCDSLMYKDHLDLSYLKQLERLKMRFFSKVFEASRSFPQEFPELWRLKQLELEIIYAKLGDSLIIYTSLIKACPSLSRFSMRSSLSSSSEEELASYSSSSSSSEEELDSSEEEEEELNVAEQAQAQPVSASSLSSSSSSSSSEEEELNVGEEARAKVALSSSSSSSDSSSSSENELNVVEEARAQAAASSSLSSSLSSSSLEDELNVVEEARAQVAWSSSDSSSSSEEEEDELNVVEEARAQESTRFHHQCLEVVELVGFIGHAKDLELASHLLEIAVSLNKLVINPRYPYFVDNPDLVMKTEALERGRECARLLETKLPPETNDSGFQPARPTSPPPSNYLLFLPRHAEAVEEE